MIQVAHRCWQHVGDRPGRYQVIDLAEPRVVGVLSNTPWPLAGAHVPTRMLEAARAQSNETFLDPAAACAALLRRVQHSLTPFLGAAAWGTADDWEASWDFGGDGAWVAEVGAELALARVGNLRVVSLTSEGVASVVLREHTLELPTGTVQTACLAHEELPPDAVWTGALPEARWVLLGTPELFELLEGGKVSACLKGRAFSDAAAAVFEDIHEALLRLDSVPSSALMMVELLSPFYRYDEESDVHVVDCGGKVSLETGIARLRVLERELAARPPRGGVSKLLIDFRNTVFEDESVHMELSRITRTEFGLNPGNSSIRAAIVNTRREGPLSDNEHWFLSDASAMQWLCSRG